MTLLLVAFLAGALTVLAPCILPMLPVVIGSSLIGRSRVTPYIIIGSLSVSIIVFTYLLKVSTLFIAIPTSVWGYVSGVIVTLFGLSLVFPSLWTQLPGVNRLSNSSNRWVGSGYQQRSIKGDVIIGAALGPVFSTCSPTYLLILATVLPASFWLGTVYLVAYVAGLALVLILIAHYGDKVTQRLLPVADSRGKVKRVIGVLLVIVGLSVVFGIDKKVETWLIDRGFVLSNIEYLFLEKVEIPNEVIETDAPISLSEPSTQMISNTCDSNDGSCALPPQSRTEEVPIPKSSVTDKQYRELVSPHAYLNTDGVPITIGEQLPDKLVLLSFMTYSCINCQRTFPYLQQWHETYADEGLVVIGIHTPEFAYERNKEAVQEALLEYGVTFPVVLDNDYQTWNAYENRYWPRRYLINRDGAVVYDHIGEGAYEETEAIIKSYLSQR